ncbi:MAG: ATP-grasp domain-containing protein [Pirellulales bacterium]
MPLPADFARRAQTLAGRALDALPAACGYVGLDLILGETVGGSDDYVIEINPRPTVSYVGLRKACRNSLARAMLNIAEGGVPEAVADIHDPSDRVEFTTHGGVRRTPHARL